MSVLVFLVVVMRFADGVLGLCDVAHCTDGTRCTKSQDDRRCKCNVGYYGDLCDKNATIHVLCGENYITIRVIEDFFNYYKVPVDSLHLLNESCTAKKEILKGVTYYTSSITKDMYQTCGGKALEKNFTHISYALTLLSSAQIQGNIIRDPTIKIEYTCVYPYMRKVSLPYPVIPFSTDTVMRVDEQEVKVEMLLYKDHTYAAPYLSAPTLQLRGMVYVQVKVTKPEDFFHLVVNDCWATNSALSNSTMEGDEYTHTLLHNGCAKDETVTFLNTTLLQTDLNGASSTVRYSFQMFRFVAEPDDLYLHCTVNLCSPDEVCTPECKGARAKRAAVQLPESNRRGLLSYGPIRILRPTSNRLVTMLLPVAGIWVAGLFLLAIIAITKAGKRRLNKLTE